ncbi:hypothetical protein ABVK25_005613 [Lepraria finkii]|uniref:Uncharacterized protein n=1 Tax=Lepraria finkii TaxID=1340010 RepID=A0ABR4B892_9LECA
MEFIIFLLTLLLNHILLIPAIPIQPQAPENGTTSSNLIIPANLNITIPPPPPGFHLEISYDSESRLSPLAVYHNTILTLYEIANQYSWTQIWIEPTTSFSVGWRTWILVMKEPGRRLPPLRTSHVILALYHGVAQMSRDRGFCQMVIEMFVDQALIGNVIIKKSPTPPTGVAGDGDGGRVRNGNESAVGLGTPATNSSDGSLGIVIYDVDMKITYSYNGARINSRDFFTAIMDGMIYAARNGKLAVCPSLDAMSAEANLVFHVVGQVGSPQPMRYDVVTQAMKALFLDMTFQQRRFEEIGFSFAHQGVQVGEGYVRKLALGLGNGTSAAK